MTTALEALARDLDAVLLARGWDAPAWLAEIHEQLDGTYILAPEPLVVLRGHPGCDLLRQQLVAGPQAIGVVLVVEGAVIGWEPGAHRLVHFLLRDGTELIIHTTEDEPSMPVEGVTGLVPALLRRSLVLPSECGTRPVSFPHQLTIAWQVLTLVRARLAGRATRRVPDPSEWGHLTIPGHEIETQIIEPWMGPIGAALAGEPLDEEALADAFRAGFGLGQFPSVLVFPFARGGDAVGMTPELAAWCDDELLVAYCDWSTPGLAELGGTLVAGLGPAWEVSFAAYTALHPELR